MEIKKFELSQEQHMKDYPRGYEIAFDKPQRIEILWNDGFIEKDEVIEIHLWQDRFSDKYYDLNGRWVQEEWKIAFEHEKDGRIVDVKRIRGWRILK